MTTDDTDQFADTVQALLASLPPDFNGKVTFNVPRQGDVKVEVSWFGKVQRDRALTESGKGK